MTKIKDVDLRVQTWESVHFRLMYQEKLLQGSRLRRPPEANDIAGVYAVISKKKKNAAETCTVIKQHDGQLVMDSIFLVIQSQKAVLFVTMWRWRRA